MNRPSILLYYGKTIIFNTRVCRCVSVQRATGYIIPNNCQNYYGVVFNRLEKNILYLFTYVIVKAVTRRFGNKNVNYYTKRSLRNIYCGREIIFDKMLIFFSFTFPRFINFGLSTSWSDLRTGIFQKKIITSRSEVSFHIAHATCQD